MSKKGIVYEFPLRKNCSEVKATGTEQGRATIPEQEEAPDTRSSAAAAAAAPLTGLLPNLTFSGIRSPQLCVAGLTSRLEGGKLRKKGSLSWPVSGGTRNHFLSARLSHASPPLSHVTGALLPPTTVPLDHSGRHAI